MKQLIAALAMAGLLIMSTQAYAGGCGMGGGGGKGCSMGTKMKEGPVTITGTVIKEVKKKHGKDIVTYVIVDNAGKKISMPTTPPANVKYEDYVNVNVKVTGAGTAMQDGTVCKLKTITAIEKVAAPAATSTAAPASEPAAKKCH